MTIADLGGRCDAEWLLAITEVHYRPSRREINISDWRWARPFVRRVLEGANEHPWFATIGNQRGGYRHLVNARGRTPLEAMQNCWDRLAAFALKSAPELEGK